MKTRLCFLIRRCAVQVLALVALAASSAVAQTGPGKFGNAVYLDGIVPILVEIAQAPNRYLGTGSRRRNLVSGNNKGACDEQASIPEEARQTHG